MLCVTGARRMRDFDRLRERRQAFKSLQANGDQIRLSRRDYALRAARLVKAIVRGIVAILAVIGGLVVLGALLDALG